MATAVQTLDVDVQLMILDVLSQSSPTSLLNVALSSKSLYRLSRSFIYSVIHFTFNRSRRAINGRLIKQLLADENLSARVREIRILWAPSAKFQPGEGSKEDLELLGRALPKLTGLKTFIWDAQYPILSWLLEALQTQHPQCLLYIRHPASVDPARTLQRFDASASLFYLDITLSAGQHQALLALQKVLNSVQNLRDLTITSAFKSHHITLNQEKEPKTLRLRSLELYSGVPDALKLSVAWPILERLSLDNSSYFRSFEPDFSGLKSLRLRGRHRKLLDNALKSCKRLEILDLAGSIDSVWLADEDLWANVGKTLIKLRFHRTVLSPADMERIAKHFPNLCSLGLDLICNGKAWPYERLKYIADELWFLVHLELNILIDNPQHDHPTSPKATLNSVPEVWKYLWQQITNSRVCRGHIITKPRLRSLDLIAGSHRPVSEPSSSARRVDQQRFAFDLCERDDEARLGIVNVKCTEVEALLSKISSAEARIVMIAKERARKGPHIEMPIVTDRDDTTVAVLG